MAETCCGHARNIYRQIYFWQLDHVHYTLGDVYGLIAYTLEVCVDFAYGQNEAEIHRHRLLHG
jgi:hypothetical protein